MARAARVTSKALVLLAGWPLTGGGAVLAQLIDPGVLNPGLQQQQQLQQQQRQLPEIERGKPKPLIEPPAEEGPAVPGDPELLINKVQIQGAQVIEAARLEAVFAPLLGKPVRFSRLQQAVNEASNLYRDAGFFTSRVVLPAGALKDGVLTVVAVEGYLEGVEVVGKGSPALKAWAQRYMGPVLSTAQAPRPIKFSQLERQILAMQSVGGVRFSSSLAQGSSFAASKLVIELNPQLLSGSVGINNNIQLQLGDYQVNGALQGNVLDLGNPLQVDVSGSNAFPYPGGSASGTVGLTTPIGSSGLKLALLGALTSTTSTSLVPGVAASLTTGGNSQLGSVALRYPLVLSRTRAVNVSLQADLQNSSNNLFFDGAQIQSSDTRLRVLRLGFDASRSSPFSSSYAGLTISQGLPIWGAQVISPDPLLANPNGSTSFISGKLTLRHQQRIGATNAFVTLTGMGQLAGTPLPSPEDFSYGGPFLGRAYRSSFLIADQGVAGGIEISYSFYPGQATLTPFAYYDVGSVFQAAGSSAQDPQSAGSVGIGLRGSWGANTSFEVGWGIPEGILSGVGIAGRDGPANSIVYFRAGVTF